MDGHETREYVSSKEVSDKVPYIPIHLRTLVGRCLGGWKRSLKELATTTTTVEMIYNDLHIGLGSVP